MTHRHPVTNATSCNAGRRSAANSRTGDIAPAAAQSDQLRRNELARLLPLWPHERDDLTIAGRRRVVRLLERALRRERQRGRSGHWTYDVARHAALLNVWRAECAALKSLERTCSIAKIKSPR